MRGVAPMVSVPRLSRRFNQSEIRRTESARSARRAHVAKFRGTDAGVCTKHSRQQTSVSHLENSKFKLDIHNRHGGSVHFVNPTGVTVAAATHYSYGKI